MEMWWHCCFASSVPGKETGFMKKLYTAIFAVALLCGLSLAQEPTTTPSSDAATQSQQSQPQQTQSQPDPAQNAQPAPLNTQSPRVAPGSVIPVQLTKGIDAKKTKPGDEVDARVTQDMKTGNGDLVIAKDTKVVGHVTEAQARTKDQKESQIGIAFDHAVTKDGSVVSLPMSIQAIISPQALNPNRGTNDSYASQSPTSEAGGAPTSGGGRASGSGMGGGMTQPRPSNDRTPSENSASGSSGGTSAPQITANTQGVVGISDMKLSTAGETTEGSVISSEKNNVKLENGTLMLLRVNH
jgi:hypothetical protein